MLNFSRNNVHHLYLCQNLTRQSTEINRRASKRSSRQKFILCGTRMFVWFLVSVQCWDKKSNDNALSSETAALLRWLSGERANIKRRKKLPESTVLCLIQLGARSPGVECDALVTPTPWNDLIFIKPLIVKVFISRCMLELVNLKAPAQFNPLAQLR